MSLLLDAGALIAFERGSKTVRSALALAEKNGDRIKTTTAVVAQVWRQGAKQVALGRLLRGIEEVPLNPPRARDVGGLLGRARTNDVVDGTLIDVASTGDEILTSDPDDMHALAAFSGKTLIITPVS